LIGEKLANSLNHGVTGDPNPHVGNPLLQQILLGYPGWSAQEVAQMIDEDSVVFLGHPTVVATKTCFHMHEGEFTSIGRDAAGKGGICVTLDDHSPAAMLAQVLVESRYSRPNLTSSSHSTHTEVGVRFTQAKGFEERFRETPVIVLPGVDHCGGRTEKAYDVGEFDDLGPGAENDGH